VRCSSVVALTVALLACAGPAHAETVTLGPPTLPAMGSGAGEFCMPPPPPTSPCPAGETVANSNISGVTLVAPEDGVITSWRVVAFTAFPSLVVIRATGSGNNYLAKTGTPTALDGSGGPNAASVPIATGDKVGLFVNVTPGGQGVAELMATGGSYDTWRPSLGTTTPATPSPGTANNYLLYNADETYKPVVLSSAPASGASGQAVVITGTHLTESTGVSFGATPATSFKVDSNSQITAIAPGLAAGALQDVTVTGPGGTSLAKTAARFTETAPPAPPGPSGPSGPSGASGPTGPAGPTDKIKPRISLLLLSPASFTAANIGGSVASAVGTRVVYRVSEKSTLRFGAERATSGRRSGKACVRRTARNAKKRKCTRYVAVKGSFTRTATKGLHVFRFTGRLAGHTLGRGVYRLVAVATDPAKNRSAAVRRSFKITG
jgi:hypothetical protein